MIKGIFDMLTLGAFESNGHQTSQAKGMSKRDLIIITHAMKEMNSIREYYLGIIDGMESDKKVMLNRLNKLERVVNVLLKNTTHYSKDEYEELLKATLDRCEE